MPKERKASGARRHRSGNPVPFGGVEMKGPIMLNAMDIDTEHMKRIFLAGICSLFGALLGSFLFPGIGTMMGQMCSAG